MDLLSGLPVYEELNVIKTNHAFRGYAMSYKAELVKNKRSNWTVRSKQILSIEVLKTCLLIF